MTVNFFGSLLVLTRLCERNGKLKINGPRFKSKKSNKYKILQLKRKENNFALINIENYLESLLCYISAVYLLHLRPIGCQQKVIKLLEYISIHSNNFRTIQNKS